MTARFIVTAAPGMQKNALAELASIATALRITRDFKDGVFLIATDRSERGVIEDLIEADPIYVKHVMPVQAQIGLAGCRTTDLPAVLEGALAIADLAPGERFSVQCRRVGDHAYNAKDIEVFVGSHFESKGAIPAFSDTEISAPAAQKVLSAYLYRSDGYIGFSTVRDNLNEHCDEYRICSRHPRNVSRAEFKLLEAFRKFGLAAPRGRALDLGAAPGGWTQVLVESGMEVVAVDPAELDAKVVRSPRVTHIKARAEEYAGSGKFDMLVNDMGTDPETSAEMMVRMAACLRPGTHAIMTVKLVIDNPGKLLGNIRPVLEQEYEILNIKHLYHNRAELTVLLRRKRS